MLSISATNTYLIEANTSKAASGDLLIESWLFLFTNCINNSCFSQ
jgi:hypothetical protein